MKIVDATFAARAILLRFIAVVLLLAFTLASSARAQTPGTVDSTFDAGTGPNSYVGMMAVGSDGKIVIQGEFTDVDNVFLPGLARLNVDGSLDTNFDSNQSGSDNYAINSLAVQSDGKIVIGGRFTKFDNAIREYVARLDADGTLDTTFTTNSGANDVVNSVALQSDGKIVIGGNFYQFQGENRSHVARLNTDGTLDDTFDPAAGTDGEVDFVLVQSNGKIIIAGSFTMVDGAARTNLARLNSDGSLDTGFDPGAYKDGTLYSLAVQTDGKILIGGQFTMVDSVARANIARLNANGTLDTGFDPGTGTDNAVYTLAVQTDGKIVIGGAFTEVNGTARNRIAQLNADGSLDTDFKPGSGPNDVVYAAAVQPDGKVVIGGQFTIINGSSYNDIARLYGEPVPVITSAATATATVGTAFSYQIAATNGPTRYGAVGLPSGLKVNAATGVISGTPTTTGTHTLTVKASNEAGAATATVVLTVKPPAPQITSAATATATEGKAFSYQIRATNGPTSYGVVGLPKGLKIDPKTGLISGTPTIFGTKTLMLKATNAGGTGSLTLTLTIKEGVPAITSVTTAAATVGKAFAYQIRATNDPTSYSVGGLTDGLSLDKTSGLISGTPKTAQTLSLTLHAANGTGTGSAPLTVTVGAN